MDKTTNWFYVMASLKVEGVRGKHALLSSVLSVPLLPIFQAWVSSNSDTNPPSGGEISTVITLKLSRARGCSSMAHHSSNRITYSFHTCIKLHAGSMGYLLSWLSLEKKNVSDNLILKLKPGTAESMQVFTFFWGVAGVVAGAFADHNLPSYYLFISMSSHCWFTLVFWQPPYLDHDKFNLNRYGTVMQKKKKKKVAQFHCLKRCNLVVSASYTNMLVLHFFFCQAVIYTMRFCI